MPLDRRQEPLTAVPQGSLSHPFQRAVRLADHFDGHENLGPNGNDAVTDHVDFSGGHNAEIKDPTFGIGTPVVDPHDDTLAVFQVGNPDHRVERKLPVGGRAVFRAVALPVGSQSPDPPPTVIRGFSLLHGERFVLVEAETLGWYEQGRTS